MSTLLIVDGHAVAYRAFFAIRDLNGPDQRPTNAIFGFIKIFGRLRSVVAPACPVVVWDGGLSPDRLGLLPGYKGQRPAMPDALCQQMGALKEYLRAAGITSLTEAGVEADDLIATLCRRAREAGLRVVLASSDKDFFQLISNSVGMLNPADKTETIWSAAEVLEKTGVAPGQVVDWLSLVGDSADNISGVPGVGVKTAADLLRQFRSVDEMFTRLPEIPSVRIREALAGAEALVRRNQKLIRLRDDLPLGWCPSASAECSPDRKKLLALYRQWGFRALAAELERVEQTQFELLAPAR